MGRACEQKFGVGMSKTAFREPRVDQPGAVKAHAGRR